MNKLGLVTETERNEIYDLMNEKGALESLFLTLWRVHDFDVNSSFEQLYKRIVSDMKEVKRQIETWWKKVATKYNWEYEPNDTWNIDFETYEIFLVSENLSKE